MGNMRAMANMVCSDCRLSRPNPEHAVSATLQSYMQEINDWECWSALNAQATLRPFGPNSST